MALTKIDSSRSKRKTVGLVPYNFPDFDCGCHKNPQIQVIGGPGNPALNSLSNQRGAFRIMVQNNVHGIANALYQMLQKDPASVSKLWAQWGGEPNTLMYDIIQGNSTTPLDIADAATTTLVGNTAKISGSRIGASTITEGTRTFDVSGNYVVVSGTASGNLPNALIPWPPMYGPNAPVGNWADPNATPGGPVAGSLMNEYLAVVSASLGDGLGYSADEIAARQADMAATGIIVPPASTIQHASGGGGVSACSAGGLVKTGASILNSFIPGAGSFLGNLFGATTGCSVPDTSHMSPPPPPPPVGMAFPFTPVIVIGGLAAIVAAFWAFSD